MFLWPRIIFDLTFSFLGMQRPSGNWLHMWRRFPLTEITDKLWLKFYATDLNRVDWLFSVDFQVEVFSSPSSRGRISEKDIVFMNSVFDTLLLS